MMQLGDALHELYLAGTHCTNYLDKQCTTEKKGKKV